MVGNRFVVLAIMLGLHTSFHWAALAKACKQLWKDFVVTILCAGHVADAFGSRSLLTTMKVMSTRLWKHLQEQVRRRRVTWGGSGPASGHRLAGCAGSGCGRGLTTGRPCRALRRLASA